MVKVKCYHVCFNVLPLHLPVQVDWSNRQTDILWSISAICVSNWVSVSDFESVCLCSSLWLWVCVQSTRRRETRAHIACYLDKAILVCAVIASRLISLLFRRIFQYNRERERWAQVTTTCLEEEDKRLSSPWANCLFVCCTFSDDKRGEGERRCIVCKHDVCPPSQIQIMLIWFGKPTAGFFAKEREGKTDGLEDLLMWWW